MNYTLIKEVIAHLEQFENEHPGQESAKDFAVWFYNRVAAEQAMYETVKNRMAQQETIESSIGKFVTFMYRYAKSYTKKALEGTPLLTVDDFVYLITVSSLGSLTKMELIERNIHEKTTGMEIIRRLLAGGLLDQQDDTVDRRSKRLSITERGRHTLFTVFDNMSKVASLVSGNLSAGEKLQLLYLLQKLNDFHQPIFVHERNTSFEELTEKYLKQQKNAGEQ